MTGTAPLHILVTDKNHHVRDLLQRELMKEGHSVQCESSAVAIYNQFCTNKHLNLLILDPELFIPEYLQILKEVILKKASFPIILHTYSEYRYLLSFGKNIEYIAKDAESVYRIRQKILTHSR
jgi:DNA-binding NtrC family response regulator